MLHLHPTAWRFPFWPRSSVRDPWPVTDTERE